MPEAGSPARRLVDLVRASDRLRAILEAVRDCDPPDWLVGGGVVRNLVWDHLHGYAIPTPPRDVDVAYFDPDDLSPERDARLDAALARRLPGVPWQAKNQAAVHLWYARRFGVAVPALGSTAEAIATWPETATSIGLRLGRDGAVAVVAPLGLDDLFAMVLRRNPARVTVEEFHRRTRAKRILERWPRVRLVP